MELFFLALGCFGLCLILAASLETDEEKGESTDEKITRLEDKVDEILEELKALKELKEQK